MRCWYSVVNRDHFTGEVTLDVCIKPYHQETDKKAHSLVTLTADEKTAWYAALKKHRKNKRSELRQGRETMIDVVTKRLTASMERAVPEMWNEHPVVTPNEVEAVGTEGLDRPVSRGVNSGAEERRQKRLAILREAQR